MRRLARHLFTLCSAASLLLCVAVCVLWARRQGGVDHVSWEYDRYLPDRSAASTQFHLTSDKRRLGVFVSSGRVGPYNGNLVYGYYIRADQSGGRPRVNFRRYGNVADGSWEDVDTMRDAGGWGPVRWQMFTRSTPAPPGESSRSIHAGVSHWFAAAVLLVMPAMWTHRFGRSRRAARRGLCPQCGYDLRASPERCPECGTLAAGGGKA